MNDEMRNSSRQRKNMKRRNTDSRRRVASPVTIGSHVVWVGMVFATWCACTSVAFYHDVHASAWMGASVAIRENTKLHARSSPSPFDETPERSNSKGFGKNQSPRRKHRRGQMFSNNTVVAPSNIEMEEGPSETERELQARVLQLENIVSHQMVDIRKLKQQCKSLTEAVEAFSHVVELLRNAGLETSGLGTGDTKPSNAEAKPTKISSETEDEVDKDEEAAKEYEYFDDNEIFGKAPSSATEAADAAGAAILAAMLGGKQRMLVDVRDADLSRDNELLVQFIELSILPVAAGLEGLKSTRNRVKIVFPTVSQLLEYRRTMALAAPEVVALSTLGFDPVEDQDNLVVILAPAPDNDQGLQAMNDLLDPPEGSGLRPISQPVVILNTHMVPLSGPGRAFDPIYHLRLLRVQYMSGNRADDFFDQYELEDDEDVDETTAETPDDEIFEAAMKHAHEQGGMNHGITRSMVIRAYPKPWHVFVDTSPDSDADFVVAATFDEEPTQEQVNDAIVQCLEGSEQEDELVAQQMQMALESGQLDHMLYGGAGDDEDEEDDENNKDDDDEGFLDFDKFEEDSI